MRGSSLVPRLLIFAAVAAGVFVVALGPITDGDIYWHLAAGREMIRARALPRVDPFTLSAAGRPWVDVHWLFQVGVYLVYRASGFVGLAVAKALLVAGGAVIATRAAERAGGAVARAWCAVGLVGLTFLARHLIPIRPVIVTLVFLAVFLWVLESPRATVTGRQRRWLRLLLVLPIAQVIWGNCQGLSWLGPALVAAYLLDAVAPRALRRWRSRAAATDATTTDAAAAISEGTGDADARAHGAGSRLDGDVRPLALTLGLCVLASFVTPYGLAAVALPARLLARIVPGHGNLWSAAIAENVPPFILERTAPALIGHFKWVLAGLAAGFALVRPRRIRLAHALVLGAFAGLALMANRNVLLFYWVAAPVGAVALAPWASRRLAGLAAARPRWAPPARASVVALVAALATEIALAGVALSREAPVGSPTPFHFPVESARALVAAGIAGPVFAPDQHGGYLEFVSPALRPYIDTRLVLHTADEYADYQALFLDPARFDALAATARFNAVILTTAYPDLYLGLIRHLAADPAAWRLAFTDGYEVLFTRAGPGTAAPPALADPATIAAITDRFDARFPGRADLQAAARLHLARLLVVLGQSRQALAVLSRLDSRAAADLRARAHFAAGQLATAEGLALILERDDPGDVRGLALLAEIAVARGEPDRASAWLRRALAIDPYDVEARAVVDRIEAPRPPVR